LSQTTIKITAFKDNELFRDNYGIERKIVEDVEDFVLSIWLFNDFLVCHILSNKHIKSHPENIVEINYKYYDALENLPIRAVEVAFWCFKFSKFKGEVVACKCHTN
jgi:predicted transglutaminase-like protease